MLSKILGWGGKDPTDPKRPKDGSAPKGTEPPVPSKAFPKFVSALANQGESATVIDFGPVIGSNVAYFGERLGCKLFIEDLLTELERHRKAGTMHTLADAVESRLRQEEGSVDGILCWDYFDFLDKPSAQRVARHLVKMLKPGGAIMGFFCTSGVEHSHLTKYEIVNDQSLRLRPHPGAGGKKLALHNREIIKMFDPLVVAESFLLKNNSREILLRRK